MFGQIRRGIGKDSSGAVSAARRGVGGRARAAGFTCNLLLGIPPKFSVANTVGFLKGKSAIRIHREYLGRQRNFTGYHFWAKGYCVSVTVQALWNVGTDFVLVPFAVSSYALGDEAGAHEAIAA